MLKSPPFLYPSTPHSLLLTEQALTAISLHCILLVTSALEPCFCPGHSTETVFQ